MNRSDTACSDDRLRSLLRNGEDSREYQTATQHVEACAACQARLEQLAADRDLCREAM